MLYVVSFIIQTTVYFIMSSLTKILFKHCTLCQAPPLVSSINTQQQLKKFKESVNSMINDIIAITQFRMFLLSTQY